MERLTPQEESVMNAFWSSEAKTTKEAMSAIPEPRPPYTTIASIVRNLESKGYLKGTHLGRQYEYTPLVSREEYSSHSIGRIVGQYYTGSYKEVVQQFVQTSKLSTEELQEIISLIEAGGAKE